jgi:hypothetical protein
MREPEACRAARMIEQMGLDLGAVRERDRLAGLESVMFDAGRQTLEPDGEDRRGEQPVEGRLGALAAEIAAIGPDHPVLAQDGRLEERQAPDMVEMQVAQKNIDVVREAVGVGLAQGRDAGARIDDEQPLAAAHLDAGRASAELHEVQPGGRGRAARSPEADLEQI